MEKKSGYINQSTGTAMEQDVSSIKEPYETPIAVSLGEDIKEDVSNCSKGNHISGDCATGGYPGGPHGDCRNGAHADVGAANCKKGSKPKIT